MENTIAAGTTGLVKHVSSHSSSVTTRPWSSPARRRRGSSPAPRTRGRPRSSSGETTCASTARRRGGADELIVDPEAIAKVAEQEEARRVRGVLEGRAAVALSDLRKLFEGYPLRNRTEAEIAAIVDLRDRLRLAAQNAG